MRHLGARGQVKVKVTNLLVGGIEWFLDANDDDYR